MKNLSDDASLPEQIPQLTQEIATIDQALKELDTKTRATLAAENPEQGIFYAAEIHALRQQKLVLQTRKELRAVRIRRIRYLGEALPPQNPTAREHREGGPLDPFQEGDDLR